MTLNLLYSQNFNLYSKLLLPKAEIFDTSNQFSSITVRTDKTSGGSKGVYVRELSAYSSWNVIDASNNNWKIYGNTYTYTVHDTRNIGNVPRSSITIQSIDKLEKRNQNGDLDFRLTGSLYDYLKTTSTN